MNSVAVLRFLTNGFVAVGCLALFLAMLWLPGRATWLWATALFGVAVLAIFSQAVLLFFRRKEAKTAWDEQSQASNQASYVFGYWCVMAVFLGCLAFVALGWLSAEAAFFYIGLPLAVGPAAYMAVAFLRGRAG